MAYQLGLLPTQQQKHALIGSAGPSAYVVAGDRRMGGIPFVENAGVTLGIDTVISSASAILIMSNIGPNFITNNSYTAIYANVSIDSGPGGCGFSCFFKDELGTTLNVGGQAVAAWTNVQPGQSASLDLIYAFPVGLGANKQYSLWGQIFSGSSATVKAQSTLGFVL